MDKVKYSFIIIILLVVSNGQLILGKDFNDLRLTKKDFMSLAFKIISKGWDVSNKRDIPYSRGTNIGSAITYKKGDGESAIEYPLMWSVNSVGFHNGLHGERMGLDLLRSLINQKKLNEDVFWPKITVYTNLQPCWMCTTEFISRTKIPVVYYTMKDAGGSGCPELFGSAVKSSDLEDEFEINIDPPKEFKDWLIKDKDSSKKLPELYTIKEPHSAMRNLDLIKKLTTPISDKIKMINLKITSDEMLLNIAGWVGNLGKDDVKSKYANFVSDNTEDVDGLVMDVNPLTTDIIWDTKLFNKKLQKVRKMKADKLLHGDTSYLDMDELINLNGFSYGFFVKDGKLLELIKDSSGGEVIPLDKDGERTIANDMLKQFHIFWDGNPTKGIRNMDGVIDGLHKAVMSARFKQKFKS